MGVRQGGRHAPAFEQPAGARRHPGLVEQPAARRPRLLLPPRQPRRHLRGRRQVHQRARVRRRRALPEPFATRRSPAPVGCKPRRPRPLPRGRAAADPARSAAAPRQGRGGSVRTVARTLLVTNDFPPRTGGIQRYLLELATRLPDGELARLRTCVARLRRVRRPPALPGAPASDFADGARADGRSGGRSRSPAAHGADTVWFGAAAPLALLGPRLRRAAGITRVLASSHGHEVGWSMLPGARQALRRIGRDADVVTTVSRYTRARVAAAFGPAAALEPLPPGIDTHRFRPDAGARAAVRRRHGLGEAPVVTCISRLVARKGQDMLIRALPRIRARVPGTRLVLVGGGPDAGRLRALAVAHDVAAAVVFAGAVADADLPAYHAAGDVFALPCRTRGGGLDVEGLGIALLEAAAAGLPVVAGRSGGAPETVRDGRTGHVVDGRDLRALVDALVDLLADPDRAATMGAAGRAWMESDWDWADRAARLATLLDGTARPGVRAAAPAGRWQIAVRTCRAPCGAR